MASVTVSESGSVTKRAGFTVVEAMVALTLVLLVFLGLSLALLTASGERVERSGRRLLDAPVDLALERLRSDVRFSQGVDLLPGYDPYAIWQETPLAIHGHWGGGVILYAFDAAEAELLRIQGGSRSTVVRRVERFRWRFVGDVPRRVVEIEIAYRVTGTYRGARASTGAGDDVARATRLVVTPRRRVGATWW